MEIRLATPADAVAWDVYVDDHPRGTPYHASSWWSLMSDAMGYRNLSLIARRGHRYAGVLPLLAIDSPITGCRLVSSPLASYGGPLADDDRVAGELVRRARCLTRAVGADHLELRYGPREGDPPETAGLREVDRHSSFRRELPDEPDEVVSRLPRKCRRMVRLGQRAGLVAEAVALRPGSAPSSGAGTPEPGEGSDPGDARRWLEGAHHLVATTMRNLGTPCYSASFLRDLLARDPERWFLWIVRDGERLAAVVYTATHDGAVYPTIAGADRDFRSDGINNFLYATLMEHAVARGIRTFDFGRSKDDSGPYHFKRHFGFEPRRLRYSYYLVGDRKLPEISPTNSFYRPAIEAWKRLPVGLAKLVGPRLIGHFA